ncbi:hypothetical protein [Streptomyces sp. SID2119]|uniref:hypothetical protein n=1 Tax=Streptomyces sp. SID2119 TaxID=2690253 RepID=UPI00136B6D16|nr:hypothetical protein [Streptomyces sp. SID2119]MYW29688.1 hypothetical protein [Streptomyces sp. SID2119]
MRTDQTAMFVASRLYIDQRAAERAVYEHNRRVARALKGDALAAEPRLTLSGSTVMALSDYECQACRRSVGMAFAADSSTHRIVNRSGEPTRRTVSLCTRCWSDTVRHDGDEKKPGVEVSYA